MSESSHDEDWDPADEAERVGEGQSDSHLDGTEDFAPERGATAGFLPGDEPRRKPGALSGRLIGQDNRYRVIERLGRGNMGEVFRAEDVRFNKKVAIKFIAPHLMQDELGRARFLNEARAATAAKSRYIIEVLDVGRFEDRDFIVMELAESALDKFGAQSTGERLPVKHVMHLLRQACVGLMDIEERTVEELDDEGSERLVRRSIIHRDIKPANILLVESEDPSADCPYEVRVADFGAAKISGLDLTIDSAPMTARYASPEQWYLTGTKIDSRSDMYSLGLTFYEMLTGEAAVPDSVGTTTDRVRDLIDGSPFFDPSGRRPDLPQSLCEVIVQMTSKHPDNRFGSFRAVVEVLDGIIRGEEYRAIIRDISAEELREISRPAAIRAAMLVGVPLIVVMGLVVGYFRGQGEMPPNGESYPGPAEERDVSRGDHGDRSREFPERVAWMPVLRRGVEVGGQIGERVVAQLSGASKSIRSVVESHFGVLNRVGEVELLCPDWSDEGLRAWSARAVEEFDRDFLSIASSKIAPLIGLLAKGRESSERWFSPWTIEQAHGRLGPAIGAWLDGVEALVCEYEEEQEQSLERYDAARESYEKYGEFKEPFSNVSKLHDVAASQAEGFKTRVAEVLRVASADLLAHRACAALAGSVGRIERLAGLSIPSPSALPDQHRYPPSWGDEARKLWPLPKSIPDGLKPFRFDYPVTEGSHSMWILPNRFTPMALVSVLVDGDSRYCLVDAYPLTIRERFWDPVAGALRDGGKLRTTGPLSGLPRKKFWYEKGGSKAGLLNFQVPEHAELLSPFISADMAREHARRVYPPDMDFRLEILSIDVAQQLEGCGGQELSLEVKGPLPHWRELPFDACRGIYGLGSGVLEFRVHADGKTFVAAGRELAKAGDLFPANVQTVKDGADRGLPGDLGEDGRRIAPTIRPSVYYGNMYARYMMFLPEVL